MSWSDQQVHTWLEEVVEAGWVSLHYDDPYLDGMGGSEIGGGGYKRVQGTFSQPASRTIWLLSDLRWSGLNAVVITHFGVWDSKNSGMLRGAGQLPSQVRITQGGGHVIREGDLALSIG